MVLLLLCGACAGPAGGVGGDGPTPTGESGSIPDDGGGSASTVAADTTTTTTTVTTTTTTTAVGDVPPVDWSDAATVVELGGGWTVARCQGDAPLLCFERDGEVAGLVEAISHPVDEVGESLDPSESLQVLADGFVESMAADRAVGCGPDYVVEPLPVEDVSVGGLPGLRFGYSGLLADGTLSELVVHHATIDGDRVVVLAAPAYAADGCPGRDELPSFHPADLASLVPELGAVLAVSPLPPDR